MIRVLLVDDDALTLELHRSFLGRLEGFDVVGECSGARAALAAIVADPPDLVLLDVTMPDGTGIDVLRHVRARGLGVDVIAITGVRDAEVVRSMAVLGVAQYLVKPFAFATFAERLGQYRDFHDRAVGTAGEATQAEIDALFGAMRTPGATPLPKGLSALTLARVAQTVQERGAVSAREAAESLGMSRVAARRYLEHLADERRVLREPRHGRAGRPETEYRWR